MLKRTERLVIAVVIFVVSVLVLTRIDFLIHSDLYQYGLQYNDSWFLISQITYTIMYQIIIVCLFLYTRNKWLLLVFESFVLSAGQDLVYLGLWGHGAFPAGSWDWMVPVTVLGFSEWLTWMQFLTVGTAMTVAFAVIFVSKRRS